jgi:hypothetical protein
MRLLVTVSLIVVLAAGSFVRVAAQAPALPPVLRPGDAAPAFTLPGTDGRTYRLADYKGVRPVVLAWFPKGPIRE